MTESAPRLAGAILCGGNSIRMGRDKATIVWEGRPLVQVLASRLAAVAEPVWLSVGNAPRAARLGLDEIIDAPPDSGPLGGIAASLDHSPHPLLAVVAVDMPFANPELFRFMADLHDDEDVVVPVDAQGPQPLHAVWSKTALTTVRRALAAKRFAINAVLDDFNVREVYEEEWRALDDGRFALNLNRPEDLELLR